MTRLLPALLGAALLSVSVFFAWVSSYVVSTEVMPAIRDGSFNVETSTMILNIVWEGNQIYLLLSAYVFVGIVSGVGAFRSLKKAMSS